MTLLDIAHGFTCKDDDGSTHANREPSKFRVSGFLRIEPGKQAVWCAREEATHVTGRGVCGCVTPIENVIDEGLLAFTPEMLEILRAEAARRHGRIAWGLV